MTIQTISTTQMKQVTGGFGPLGAILGALAGGFGQYASGSDAKGIAAGIAFGALSGFTGGLAGITTGFARIGWSARSVGSAVISGSNMNTTVKLKQTE